MTVIALLYLYGVRQQFLYVNTDRFRTDQAAYLNAAEQLKTSNYIAITERNRMPVYPFLLSLVHGSELSDETFFARGKLLNIGLSLLILLIFFWLFQKYLPLFTAVNLILIHIFTLYMFKAAYVQAELLFYLLNFVCFLLMCHLLWRPGWRDSWKTAVLTGILLGVTHLTKASILPGLALFVGTAVLQAIVRQVGKRPYRQFFLDLAVPMLVILFFLLTIWPYIQNSKEQFGHYFYNVNSTFYIWYDHWDEVEAGTKAHGDRVGWPEMPPEEIPTAATYFREHSWGQIGQRLFEGFLAIFITMLYSYGYLKYLGLMLGFTLSLVIINRRKTRAAITKFPFLSLFVSSFFNSYLLLYAWYWPISSGNRFILALFSPLMFTLVFVVYRLFNEQLLLKATRHSEKTVHLGKLLNWGLFAVLLVDVCIILTVRIGTMFGGF